MTDFKEITETKWRSRKFILALITLIVLSVSLFTGLIAGGDFNIGAGLVLGLYGAANTATKISKTN